MRGANETTFTGNTIINNGPSGGGFLTGTNTVILTNNTITGNTGGNAAGIEVRASDSVTLTNNTITGNTGGLNGGGVRLWGNVITLMDNAISDNSASVGGGVWVQQDGSIVTLINNTITGNTASRGGGGVFLNGGVVTIINSVISNNVTDRANGGGVQVDADMVRLINNTITGNAATDGISGGVRIDLSADTDRADLYNNIIWGNSSGPGINDLTILNDGNLNFIPSPVNLFHNDFDHSAAGTFIQLPFPIDPSNLDNVDPLFVNAPGGDFHLQAASPVINMGDNNAPSLPATDKDGAPRIIGGVVDLGAFEFLNPALFPDLVVTSLGGSTSGLIGGQVAASAALENTGGDVASGAFRLGFYWSTDAVITTGDVFSGSFCDFVDLAAGGIDNCDLLVAVPDTLPPGPHFFGAIVDDLGEITESLETNNSRVADTGVVNLVDTCVLALDLGHATGTLTLGFELGTLDPAIWDVWLISIFGFNNLWSARIPVIDPIVSFPVAFPFPSIGNIGIVTTLTTAENGLACADFKIVDTGGLGASPEELEDLVEQSGVLQDAMRR